MGLINAKNTVISSHEEFMDIGFGVFYFYFETHGNLYMKNKPSYFRLELDKIYRNCHLYALFQ